MDNVVLFNRNNDARNGELTPEDVYFFIRVFLPLLLPQLPLFVYGGFPPVIAFVACAAAGSALGIAKWRSPSALPSCVEAGTATPAPAPARADSTLKRAA